MIKIHDKIWYVIKPGSEEKLAYMCQYEQTKDGSPTSSVAKMQSTGRSWARTGEQTVYKKKEGTREYLYNDKGYPVIDHVIPAREGCEHIADNSPTSGFYVGCSVSRWSTSNKLFRVEDPRGFTVEIPTDNLATLLHHTTVVKGIVQEPCVWGRDGANHILLPINSEPYLITLDQMDTLENKLISVKDLKVGDWVRMFEDEMEYYYAGKIRGTWNLRGQNTHYDYYSSSRGRQTTYSEYVEVKDEKWSDVFLCKRYGEKWYVETKNKPKIVEVIKNEKLTLEVSEYQWYVPKRVQIKSGLDGQWSYVSGELIDVEFKK
jgi:hypothetical protein